MSNIAPQMRHRSTTVLGTFKRTNVWVYHRVFGQVLIFVMERRGEYRRTLAVEAHVLARGPLRFRPLHQFRTGRSCSALHPGPNNKAMLHPLTRTGPIGRDANSLASTKSVLISASLCRASGSGSTSLGKSSETNLALMLFDDGASSNSPPRTFPDLFSRLSGCFFPNKQQAMLDRNGRLLEEHSSPSSPQQVHNMQRPQVVRHGAACGWPCWLTSRTASTRSCQGSLRTRIFAMATSRLRTTTTRLPSTSRNTRV